MQKFFFKLFLLITFLFLSSADLLAQVNWTKYTSNPVITVPGAWYNGAIKSCVIYNADSSRYEMFFSGSTTASGGRPCRIGLAYSNDGLSWQVRPTPVLTPTAGTWDSYTTEFPFVIIENGVYKMWYTGAQNTATYKIGYATSPDGINWTKHPTPVLEAGTDAWEAGGVAGSHIMKDTGGYKLWYWGANTGWTKECIGYATSTDGILWQKDMHNNPVLEPGISGEWDDTWVVGPSVMFKDNIYYMWYLGTGTTWGQFRIGLATSSDGITNWTKHPANPVLRPSPSGWDNGEVESPSVILVGDTLYMYYDGSPSGSYVWQIGIAKSHYSPLPLPPGTYTVGTGGNFATIQDAFNKLSTDGVAGNVTLELIDELYTATTTQYGFLLNGPIPGAGPNSRVTIKPAENKNVIVEGNGEGIFHFNNTSYLILDGVGISGPTTLTVHNLVTTPVSFNDAIDFIGNCDHNVVQNTISLIEDITGVNSGITFWPETNVIGAPDSNLVQNNFIMKATYGIYLGANQFQGSKASGNIIRGNIIGGSEKNSLISCAGIQTEGVENTIIENNLIRNINRQVLTFWEPDTYGINTWEGIETVIRNNIIHNLSSNVDWGIIGILLSASSPGVNNMIYNNMIFNINSTSIHSDSRIAGIQIYNQVNPRIYYNSIYLSGTGANQLGSAALSIYSNVTNADVKNNIFVNTRDESPYCASAI